MTPSKAALYLSNLNELKKIKNSFEETKKNDEQTSIRLTNDYVFCFSSVHSRRQILYKYCDFRVYCDGKSYYMIRFPSSFKLQNPLNILLRQNGISLFREVSITDKPFRIARHSTSLPRNWSDKFKLIKTDFENLPDYEKYIPPENPFFYLYNDGKNLEDFVFRNYTESESPYDIYRRCLCSHLLHATGLNKQQQIEKILIDESGIKFIRSIMPDHVRIDNLIDGQTFVKSGKNIIFNIENTEDEEPEEYSEEDDPEKYNIDNFGSIDNEEEQPTEPKEEPKRGRQYIKVPFRLLPHVFHSSSFGKNGFKYFLTLVYACHCYSVRFPKIQCKPSTIARIAGLNTKRGTKYLFNAIFRPLTYLKDIGFIRAFGYFNRDNSEPTLSDIKADKAITIYMNRIESFIPPKLHKISVQKPTPNNDSGV